MNPGDVYSRKPPWIRGGISYDDAIFLFDHARQGDESTVVEIGSGTGISAAVLAHALHERGGDWRLLSYDILEVYPNVDPPRPIGAALYEMAAPEIAERVEFRNPCIAMDLRDRHDEDEIGLLFIDANHAHPWPALDLLATLPLLKRGASVFLHDVNLPTVAPGQAAWGAKWLFDDLSIDKAHGGGEPPNIGRVTIPSDKAALQTELQAIVAAHAWEGKVPDAVAGALV